MRLLLDTHVWLWMLTGPDRLSAAARTEVEAARNDLYLSAASAWELAVKVALGRLTLPEAVDAFVPRRMAATGVSGLVIDHAHVLRLSRLEPHHRDPFDRILVAQAQVEQLIIVTTDRTFGLYDVPTMWAG